MTFDLSNSLENELRHLAGVRGKGIEILVEEAVREYLDAAAITDVSPMDVAATQSCLLGELADLTPWWDDAGQRAFDEAR